MEGQRKVGSNMKIGIRAPVLAVLGALFLSACRFAGPAPVVEPHIPAPADRAALAPADFWNSATIYFLLTDRFYNGDPTNDLALGRAQDGAVLRSYVGGDLAGVLRKLEEGYFEKLGVDAILDDPVPGAESRPHG